MRYVLIMAGGSGKRLWPLSRQGMPKQLLKIVGGSSLLRIAYERIEGLVPPENVLVCTGADYAEVVAAELPEIDPANILGEPEGRDSLNAIAWPAAVLAARDPDAVMAVVASDHVMRPVDNFRSALVEGFAVAEADPAGAGHLRGDAVLRAHRLRLPAPRRGGARSPGRARSAGVQGEAGPADRAGVPDLGRLLVELRHVRLAGPDLPRPGAPAAAGHPPSRSLRWPRHPSGWPRSIRP